MRRLRAGVSLILIMLGLLGIAVAAHAQTDDGPAFIGTIVDAEREPIAGVTILIRDLDGAEAGQAVTDSAGDWRIVLPGPGQYEVELDVGTLPDGVELREGARNPTTVDIRAGQERRLLFPMGEGVAGAGFVESFLNRSLVGLKVGLIIAMTSVGLSLIFGTTGLINFAHGELVTFGAIVAWFLNVSAGIHIVWAGLLAVLTGAALGWGLESGIWRPLRRIQVRGFQFLVLTIGLSLLAQNLLLLWYGGDFRRYAQYALQRETEFGAIRISMRDLTVMILSVVVLIGVATMLKKARIGKAMRATSDNPDLAEASGIAVDRVVVVVWSLGAGLASLGGVLLGVVSNVHFLMGFHLLLLMFAAIILGGLGSAYGAMVGGLVVGYVSEVSTLWIRPELKSVWALAILIVVLLVRPQGILGVRARIG